MSLRKSGLFKSRLGTALAVIFGSWTLFIILLIVDPSALWAKYRIHTSLGPKLRDFKSAHGAYPKRLEEVGFESGVFWKRLQYSGGQGCSVWFKTTFRGSFHYYCEDESWHNVGHW